MRKNHYKALIICLIISFLANVFFAYKARNKIVEILRRGLSTENSLPSLIYWESDPNQNIPFVTHSIFDSVSFIPIILSTDKDQEINEELIIPKGVYKIYGRSYKLNKDGLYRFIYPEFENNQRIVYGGDLDTLLSSMSWIITHGYSDDNLNKRDLIIKAGKNKLSISCGTASIFAKSILDELEIESRIVLGLSLEDWNSYDNGHTLIEVYHAIHNKWIVYDLDNNCYFTNENGPLSFIEFCNHVNRNLEYAVNYLSSDIKYDLNSNIDKNDYKYNFITESIVSQENLLRDWYKRVLQIPLIKDGNYYNFYADDSVAKRVQIYSPKHRLVKSFNEFMNTYYEE